MRGHEFLLPDTQRDDSADGTENGVKNPHLGERVGHSLSIGSPFLRTKGVKDSGRSNGTASDESASGVLGNPGGQEVIFMLSQNTLEGDLADHNADTSGQVADKVKCGRGGSNVGGWYQSLNADDECLHVGTDTGSE